LQDHYEQEEQQISQRKLLMPVISEGYASTKVQGKEDQKKKTT